MGQVSLINGLQYAGYALELSVVVLLLSRKRIRRFPALCAYVAALFGVDAVGRAWVLQHYGFHSRVYFYSYYLSDFALALGLFLLLCTFFRRACQDHQKVWEFIRPILTWILLIVIVISAAALRTNFHSLYSSLGKFILEFNQYLYFVCLVLNTVLYLMVQRFKGESDLNLLVCGLGLQLAGPAAGSALAFLMGNETILTYLSPLCSVAMMAIWMYAIIRTPVSSTTARVGSGRPPRPGLRVSKIGLKPVPAAGRQHRMASGPSALQASYLNG